MQETYYCVLQSRPRTSAFLSDHDKQDFIRAIAETKRRSQIKIYAFVLLEAQVHLVVSVPSGRLQPALVALREAYAVHYSKRNGRDGNVFLDNYAERRCYSDHRLLPVIRHAHYLPVTFGQTHHPNLARFTSHTAYLGDTRYSFVDSDELLALIAQDRQEARRRYQAMSGTSVGTGELAQAFMAVVPESPTPVALPTPTLAEIAAAVSQKTGVSLRVMQSKGRSTAAVAARRMLIAAAVTEHRYPVTEVAELLCVHHSYVSRMTYGRGRPEGS